MTHTLDALDAAGVRHTGSARSAREAATPLVLDQGADQRRIAAQLLADPAVDLIVGHHAHVVQPFENIGGKWVAYGLGNQIARHEQPRGTTEEGVIARFRLVKSQRGWQVERAEYLPTLVDLGPPIRLRDLTADPGIDPARRTAAIARTDKIVLSQNAAAAGLTRPGEWPALRRRFRPILCPTAR